MLRFKVSGMSCAHCARAVTEAIAAVDPGAAVEVDVAAGLVVVQGGTAGPATLAAAMGAQGYAAVAVP